MRVCPLGLCTFEDVCPRAPCVGCMHRLGEHIIGEMKIIGRQADHAQAQGDHVNADRLRKIMGQLGETIGRGEDFRAEAQELVNEH